MGNITISQLMAIFLLSTGLSNHVIVIPILINATGRDAWISVLIGYSLLLALSPLFLYVTKQFQDQSLFQWLSSTYSKTLSYGIAILIVIFLLIMGWITLKETVMWTDETYLFFTPILVITLFTLGASLYISYCKLNVIGICAGVLLPLVILFGMFVAIGTIPDKNYRLVAPVLVENGWGDVLHGALFAFGSVIELFLLYLLQHQVTKSIQFKHLVFLILFLSILTTGPLLGTIATFGVEEAAKIRYPAFFQWRIVGIGNYFNHLDFLSIYQWLSGAFIRLTIILYLITQAFNITNKKKRLFIQTFICFIYLLFMLAPISDEAFLKFLSNYYYLGSSIFGVVITCTIALLIKLSKNRMSIHAKK
ncbi:endospore germination permease [Virgibacillus sp. M23]|uniref:endospore germination permease n=1 Tax=Virgibacillus sp. M23 TaxID=3079030 RepID=UPI002A90E3B8|nr:endospore germination permease [Virgibacillus sp. M23]MDY7043141.1 endospore germination permease [Virgibacillus sp. M23]